MVKLLKSNINKIVVYDPCSIMFFFRNKQVMIDLGTGNNNKINWQVEDKQVTIDVIE